MRPSILFVLAVVTGVAHADFDICIGAVAADPHFDPISKKLAPGLTKTQNFAMLADMTTPSAEERLLIADLVTARANCYESNTAGLRRMPAALQNLAGRARLQFEASATDLYNNKITYGDFAKRRAQIATEYTSGMNAWQEQWNGQQQATDLAQEQAENERRRQATAQFFSRQQQIVPYQVQHPQLPTTIQTNCSTYGTMTNCTSR